MMPRPHFLLVILVLTPLAQAQSLPVPIPVQTEAMEIEYATSPEAMPLDGVELWVTHDRGATWSLVGRDDDRQSPILFRASEQGWHGFFVVLENVAGVSSTRPSAGTRPHLEAFIDFTPPAVQLQSPIATRSLGRWLVQVEWTAIDAHFDSRPIVLEYRVPGHDWEAVSPEGQLANTGRFDWRIPEGLSGIIELRACAVDQAGNRTESRVQTVVVPESVPTPPAQSTSDGIVGSKDSPEAQTLLVGSARARQRVSELLTRASVYADRGQYSEGVASLREAIRLDPTAIEAFTRLGLMLDQAGDPSRAVEAFDLALKLNPRDRAALLGASIALRRQRDYAASAERLRTVLRYRPDDAEAWLALGDVAVFQGDELLARECYLRASRIDPKAATIIEDAKQRLALMQASGRSPVPVNEQASAVNDSRN